MGVVLEEGGWSASDFVASTATKASPFDPWSPNAASLLTEKKYSPNLGETSERLDFDLDHRVEIAHSPEIDSPIVLFLPITANVNGNMPKIEIIDFWNPSSERVKKAFLTEIPLDWGWKDLPAYNSDLFVNPFIVPFRRDTVEEIAAKRARWLLNLLGVGAYRRRSLMSFFTEIFDCYPTRQTFLALSNLVEDGISVDSLRTACEFRIRFLAEAKWRLIRSGSKRSVAQPAFSDGIMGWARAAKWVNLCRGSDPSEYLDDTWVEDWHDLPPNSPERWAFADYAEQRLEMIWQDILEIDFDSSLRWVPFEFRQHYMPTDKQMRSRLGHLALPSTGTLRREKLQK